MYSPQVYELIAEIWRVKRALTGKVNGNFALPRMAVCGGVCICISVPYVHTTRSKKVY